MTRLALLVNPAAGGGRALRRLPAVVAELERRGVAHTVTRTRSLAHGRELAIAAADAGDVVVPFSGDGLVGAIAGALAGRADAILGLLPGGRGNDFARSCGIPGDPVAACATLAEGAPRRLDVGDAGGRTFVGIASVGFDSDVNRAAARAPARLGALVYPYGALRALAGWKPARFDVAVGATRRSFEGWSVAAANARAYGGGMVLAPAARLDDGALDVVLTARTSRRRFVRALPMLYRGTHVGLDAVEVLRGPEVSVAADRAFTVYADGEPAGPLPITIRVVPGAIRVLLPA